MTKNPSSDHYLKSGEATLLVENATLRYLNWGDHELIRRIYPAVRDQNWMTVPYDISKETLTLTDSGFSAEFHLHFNSDSVDFKSVVQIIAEKNKVSYSFSGTAHRDFLSNRIGICLLQPVSTCAGRKVIITHPEGSISTGKFPNKILPHQPFINIKALEWTTEENVNIKTEFFGDIFETEDQRNWSDMSFKTYSTPLSIPIPRKIVEGDRVEQKVQILIRYPQHPKPRLENIIHTLPNVSRFPAIGYSKPQTPVGISERERSLLHQLIFDHYRIDIDTDQVSNDLLKQILSDARKFNKPVELVIHADWPLTGLKELIREVKASGILIEKVLLLQKKEKITGKSLWNEAITPLRDAFPAALYGAGTDAHFTEINRAPFLYDKMSYVAFPNNPQVHSNDDRTIIENLAAQAEIIRMALALYPGKKIHVSRISLRYPPDPDRGQKGRYVQKNGYPWTVDERQWSHFYACWILMCLKYFSGADQLTFCDTAGLNGLIAGEYPQQFLPGYPSRGSVFPVWEVMAEISAFRPEVIIDCYSAHPLHYDGYCLKNKSGQFLYVLVSFSDEDQMVQLLSGHIELANAEIKVLPDELVHELPQVPLNNPGKNYQPVILQNEKIHLKPRSINFIRQL